MYFPFLHHQQGFHILKIHTGNKVSVLDCPFHIVTSAVILGFPGGARGTQPNCQCWGHKRYGFNPRVGKISWRRASQPTPVFFFFFFTFLMELSFLFNFKSNFLELSFLLLINNVFVSGVQQNDSVLHVHVSSLSQILFPIRLL